MITIHETVDFPETYPLQQLGRREELLFFDIETTGFSGDYSNLYLIGCVYFEDDTWNLLQWFADTPEAEIEVLAAFFEFLKRFSIVIHFNGDGFDIPYLQKRCQAFALPCGFSAVRSFDIYKKIRPYRNLLGLASMKQKAIEQFLGVDRDDLYSGGQLIKVYHDYLHTGEKYLFDMLMLHNADDLRGMPGILPILSYPDFLEHEFTLESQSIVTQRDIFGRDFHRLELVYKSPVTVPVPFTKSNSLADLEARGNVLTACIDLCEEELKYFYPDYKNYYYLIYEDRAIHKSVAEYVDREARIKATAKTCYTRRSGLFLPQFTPLWSPVFQREYKDKISYFQYDETFFEDQEHAEVYIRHLLDYMCRL